MIKESQSALVAGGIMCLKFIPQFAQLMLQIGSKYKIPEVTVLFGKTAVRDNIMLKLSLCKSIIAEKVRGAEPWYSL